MAVGPNHKLLICDYMHQYVFVLDNELNLLNTIGIIGGGQLTHPNGIAVDKDRTIALSNYRFHQVKKFYSMMENVFVLLVHLAQKTATLTIPSLICF